jgi:hypothetical protein
MRADDERLRKLLRNADLRTLDKALGKAIKSPATHEHD